MRSLLLLTTLATLLVSNSFIQPVNSEAVVDFDIASCAQKHGYTVDLPGTATVIHIHGLESPYNTLSSTDSIFNKVKNVLYYYKFQWAEVQLRFFDKNGILLDKEEVDFGEGLTQQDAIINRDKADSRMDYVRNQLTSLLIWPLTLLSGEIKNLASTPQERLQDILSTAGVDKHVKTISDKLIDNEPPHYIRNPYEEVYLAVKQESVIGKKDNKPLYGRDAESVTCRVNLVSLRFPLFLILGSYTTLNAETLATSWWFLYSGGATFGVLIAITLIAYFVYRNRDSKVILGAFSISVAFGSAATWFHDALANFLRETIGMPWLADYAWVLLVLYLLFSIVATLYCCMRLRGNTRQEKMFSSNVLAFIIRTVGIIMVYNAFQSRSVGIIAACSTFVPCFFASILQWFEDGANYVLSWIQVIGLCKGRKFTCISAIRTRLGCRRADTIAKAIREEETAIEEAANVESEGEEESEEEEVTPSRKGRRNSTTVLSAKAVKKMLESAGNDPIKLNTLSELLTHIDNADDEDNAPPPSSKGKGSSTLRRRGSMAK